jgi:hypothetical protein
MRHTRRVHDAEFAQGDSLRAEVVEEADAGTEQDRHDVELDLVEQAGTAVPGGVHQAEVSVAGGGARLSHGAFQAVGDDEGMLRMRL